MTRLPEWMRVKMALVRGEDPFMYVLTPTEDQLLDDALREGDAGMTDSLLRLTACPYDCEVDPDGECEHGYLSLGRRANLVGSD